VASQNAGIDEAVPRYETLKNAFKARFGEVPELYSRSPGGPIVQDVVAIHCSVASMILLGECRFL
jgi:hypothetical protein